MLVARMGRFWQVLNGHSSSPRAVPAGRCHRCSKHAADTRRWEWVVAVLVLVFVVVAVWLLICVVNGVMGGVVVGGMLMDRAGR